MLGRWPRVRSGSRRRDTVDVLGQIMRVMVPPIRSARRDQIRTDRHDASVRADAIAARLASTLAEQDDKTELVRGAQIPVKLGRYDVRGKLADGGMATVYAGRLAGPAGFERLVALKVIRPEFSSDKSFVNMFLDEARIVARLSHPNVVAIHELGEHENEEGNKRLFIAMELLFGESLWDIWWTSRQKHMKLQEDMVAWMGARIAEGLHHAHELKSATGDPQNVVHRDINPANIFVTYDGQVKIIDFGLAKAKNRISETGFGVLKGKVAYMAPEQTKSSKDIDRRADIFALGVSLWELTTDRRLFKRNSGVETLSAVAECVIPDPTSLVEGYSPTLWTILEKALQKNKEDRYANAQELAHALDEFSRSQGRVVTSSTVAKYMEELFGAQRDRYSEWIEVVSAQDKPAPEGAFRPPSTGDENAVLVGETGKDASSPKSAAPKSQTPHPEPTKKSGPSAISKLLAPLPPPVEGLPAEEELKETRRVWIWAAVFLVVGIATVSWALRNM